MDYEAEIRRIQKILDEVESSNLEDKETVDGFASDSEGEEDVHVPDSDCYESNPDDLPEQPQKKKPKINRWKGKDKTTWWKKNAPKLLCCTRSSSVIKFTRGLKGPALNANSPADLRGSLHHARNNWFISRAY